jgi:hypothetical protein
MFDGLAQPARIRQAYNTTNPAMPGAKGSEEGSVRRESADIDIRYLFLIRIITNDEIPLLQNLES